MSRRRTKILAGGLLVLLVVLAGWGYYWFEAGGRAAHLARSADPDDRLRAAHELRGRRSDSAVWLLTGLLGDAHAPVAVAAARALGQAGGPAAEAALRRAVAGDGRAEVRAAAAAELGRWPGASAELTGLLGAPEPSVRAAAAKGLALARPRAALGPLVVALSDPEREVRLWAATAIRAIVRMPLEFRAEAPEDVRRRQVDAIRAMLASIAAAEQDPTEGPPPGATAPAPDHGPGGP